MKKNNDILTTLFTVLKERKQQINQAGLSSSKKKSYVVSLMADGVAKMNDKVMEEAKEICEAALLLQSDVVSNKDGNEVKRQDFIHEVCDELFHLLVLVSYFDIEIDELYDELNRRFGISGLLEKANRSTNKK